MKPLHTTCGADLAVLADIHAASFAEPWSASALGELLASPGAFGFGGDDGFTLARVVADEAEILTLAVRPERRRCGIGAALVHAAAEHALRLQARRIFLEVAIGNAAARQLYAGIGFGEVGRRAAYYGIAANKREDALILRSNLPLSPLGKKPVAG